MLLANNINPSMYVNSNIQSMKTNANYSNLTNENGDVRINFGQTKVSNVSKSKQEELNNLLKEGKKVPKFNNEEEALNYINKTKKDIINNINNSNTSTSNLFYTGNAQTTSDLGGIFWAVMSFPYSVSWSPNLGNYYSNVGQGNISLAGYTLLNSISGVSCDAWIYNNGHSIAGTGSGELNQYFIVGGIWKTWSTPFTMNGNWNV